MTDQTLRSLQRALEPGDLAGHAKFMRERVRAGDLTQERLQLAARLDPAAKLALGDEPATDLPNWPGDAHLRLAVAASWAAFPAYEEENQSFTGKGSTLLSSLLETLDAHALELCTVDEVQQALVAALDDWAATSHPDYPEHWAWTQGARTAAWALRAREPFRHSEAGQRIQEFLGLSEDWSQNPADALLYLGHALEERDPTAHLAQEVVPWLLGLSDPVAERASARRDSP